VAVRERCGTSWYRTEGAVVEERRRMVGAAVGEGWGRCFPAEGKPCVVHRRRGRHSSGRCGCGETTWWILRLGIGTERRALSG